MPDDILHDLDILLRPDAVTARPFPSCPRSAMPDDILHDLDILLRAWRNHIADNPASDDRSSGFVSGVRACADGLEQTLAGIRKELADA